MLSTVETAFPPAPAPVAAQSPDRAEAPGLLLVGDSVGNTVLGHPTTLPVTLDQMILFTQAVVRGAERALVVADLPFGSYEASPRQAVESAVRLVKESGAHAVKVEGDERFAEHGINANAVMPGGIIGAPPFICCIQFVLPPTFLTMWAIVRYCMRNSSTSRTLVPLPRATRRARAVRRTGVFVPGWMGLVKQLPSESSSLADILSVM